MMRKKRGVEGWLEPTHGSTLQGWAIDWEIAPGRAPVDIYINGIKIGTTVANKFRQDLLNQKLSDGHLGFEFDLSPFLSGPQQLIVSAQVAGTPLQGAPQTLWLYLDGEVVVAKDISLVQKLQDAARLETILKQTGAIDLMKARQVGVAIGAINVPSGEASPALQATLKMIKELGFSTVVVNAAFPPTAPIRDSLEAYSDLTLYRLPGGRDFGSWRHAAASLKSELDSATTVMLFNDTLLGPIRSFTTNFQRLSHADFWGLSDSYQRAYHIQSSLVGFSGSYFRSEANQTLFARLAGRDKSEVILDGELALSQTAIQAHANLAVLCRYTDLTRAWLKDHPEKQRGPRRSFNIQSRYEKWESYIRDAIYDGTALNPQHAFWDTMILHYDYPFIKRELLAYNRANIGNLRTMWDVIGPDRAEWFRDMLHVELATKGGLRAPMPFGSFPTVSDKSQ